MWPLCGCIDSVTAFLASSLHQLKSLSLHSRRAHWDSRPIKYLDLLELFAYRHVFACAGPSARA